MPALTSKTNDGQLELCYIHDKNFIPVSNFSAGPSQCSTGVPTGYHWEIGLPEADCCNEKRENTDQGQILLQRLENKACIK